MILNEFFDDVDTAYENPADDNSRPYLRDLRKTKLTLKDINRLRLMSDIRRFEKNERLKSIKKQYGVQPQQGI